MKKKIFAIAIVAALAVTAVAGASLAYFTDTDKDTNVFTVGKVEIEQHEEQRGEEGLEEFEQNQTMLPAIGLTGDDEVCADETIHDHVTHFIDTEKTKNVMDKIVTVENKSTVDIYAATLIAVEDTNDVSTNFRFQIGDTDNGSWIFLRRNGATSGNNVQIKDETTGTVYTVNLKIYEEKIAPNAYSPAALTQVYMKPTATQESVKDAGETYDIECVSMGVQADGFDNADQAIAAAFNIDPTVMDDAMIKTIASMFGANFTAGYYDNGVFTPIA